ncbi:MAG TPA: acylneuraminate cytidylyltransferase family protein [Vicingus sp.]|nr:CMP-N,N'-diacetyllegionaminic acid synthase [Flavobacteriales bacterium]HRN41205.1 acylneuraminate cytidylyltransferase family protein [Vicingus sp.]
MKIIALLPMKGHSERVPNKNMKLFNGIPLFHHVLTTLQNCNLIDEVIINTDSNIISESAKKFSKVKIHNRPNEICGDFVSMNDIIAFDLNHSDGDIYLQTHSTNPLLKTTTIHQAIEKFKTQREFDSLFSVTKLQTRLYWEDVRPINHNPNELIRTQDLPPVFEENSNFFIFTKSSFKNAANKRIGKKPMMYEMDKLESVDIDEPHDFILAETIQQLNLV